MDRLPKVAIFATHPIQYQVPWFRQLTMSGHVDLTVYYALIPDSNQQGIGFGVPFQWDIPMLSGYRHRVLRNRSRRPSLDGFFSTDTPTIRAELTADRPDAAIITGWQARPLLQALLACRRLGIPAIVRAESNAMRRRRAIVRVAHRALLSQFEAFLAIGKSNRAFYTGYGVSPARIFDAAYFVDNDRIRASWESAFPRRTGLRKRWGIAGDAFCFAYVGKLIEKKRVLDLIDALRAVPAAPRPIHLLIGGSGGLEQQARARAEGLPVTFAGFLNQSELPSLYAAADCLVLPSDFGETWGLVVNEAMACSLPAIVSDRVGCGPDLVEPGVTGDIFPFGRIDRLARALTAMAASPERSRSMGEQAFSRVSSYSVQAAVNGTLAAIHHVTGRREPCASFT